MVKSIAYKRRLRRAQKFKKILRLKQMTSVDGATLSVVKDGAMSPPQPLPVMNFEGVGETLSVAKDGDEKQSLRFSPTEACEEEQRSSDRGFEEEASSSVDRNTGSIVKDGGEEQKMVTLKSNVGSTNIDSILPCLKCDDLEIVKTKYVKLKARLIQTMQSSHEYQKQMELNEKELKSVQVECKRKVCSIRCFWKDMIYQESTRPGIILKRSMLGTTN